ncbi:MAG: signal peptidase I [Eubacteriales bacterium]
MRPISGMILVILRMPGDVEYIKRIVAEPGETVEFSEDGKLLVNGREQMPEEAMGVTAALSEDIAYPYTVPEGSYFVLGDNRENSRDSRSFGAVKQGQIAGRVFLHMGMTR